MKWRFIDIGSKDARELLVGRQRRDKQREVQGLVEQKDTVFFFVEVDLVKNAL